MRCITRACALTFFGALTIAPVANAQVTIARPFNPVTETWRQRQLAASIAAQQRLFGQMRMLLPNANTTIGSGVVIGQPPIFIPSPPLNSAPGTFFPTVAVSPVQPPIFIPSPPINSAPGTFFPTSVVGGGRSFIPSPPMGSAPGTFFPTARR